MVLNIIVVELSLGIGGYYFVIINLNNIEFILIEGGYIMKFRYMFF